MWETVACWRGGGELPRRLVRLLWACPRVSAACSSWPAAAAGSTGFESSSARERASQVLAPLRERCKFSCLLLFVANAQQQISRALQ